MKIDICIPFNDLIPPSGLGMVSGKKPSYYQQLLYLIRSIELNWDKSIYDYQIHVYHSRLLDKQKKDKLESCGCIVIFDPSEIQPYLNRENIFKNNDYENEDDYTLILDTDILILNTPKLEFKKDIYVKPTSQHQLNKSQWAEVVNSVGLKYNPAQRYHFNLGCILIKNNKKKELYNYHIKYLKTLKILESYDRHLSIQLYLSILIHKFNWGILNKRMNVFSYDLPSLNIEEVDMIHYLGGRGFTEEIKNILKKL